MREVTQRLRHSGLVLKVPFFKGKKGRKSITLIVFRISQGRFAESKPCFHCIRTMRKFSVYYKLTHVVYSTATGFIVDRVDSIENEFVTSGNRKKLKLGRFRENIENVCETRKNSGRPERGQTGLCGR